MYTFIKLVLLFALADGGAPEDAAIRAVNDLVGAGQKKIGVIPVVINRRGDEEATIGRLGPRGKIMANDLYATLVSASQNGQFRGKFEVVPERVMRAALASRSVTDLSDPRKIEALASEVGNADGFVIMSVDENTSKIDVKPLVTTPSDSSNTTGEALILDGNIEVLKPNGAVVTSTSGFQEKLNLTKAAYQGESWELRRWQEDTLENVGINIIGPNAFLSGVADEENQLAKLKPNLPHPLADKTFPYTLAVRVGSTVREPAMIGGRAIIELNAGEEYLVLLQNDSHKDVYCALYIDGVNSINQQLISPEKLETSNHWFLQTKGGKRAINGWFAIHRDSQGNAGTSQQYKAFKVMDRAESVAARQGFQDNIGMITAIFYTVGMDGIPKLRSYTSSIVGTGEGTQGSASLKFNNGTEPRGILLASTTLYYRTGAQLQEIKAGSSKDVLATTTTNSDPNDGWVIDLD